MTPEEVRRATGAAVHDLRIQAGLTPDQMGISRAQLYQIEQGKADAKVWTLCVIARALKIPFPVLAQEIDRHRDIPAAETGDSQILGDILLIVRFGRLDLPKCARFFEDVLGLAKQKKARKVLLDLAGVHCDFSAQEQYQGTMDGIRWYEANSYKPKAIAVVANQTLDGFGAKVARDHGVNARLFRSREEALKWLNSLG